MEEKVLIEIDGLKEYFPLPKKSIFSKKRRYLRALDGVSLQIKKGETFGLVGESGCGKSTLGKSLLQLYKPTAGEVTYYPNDRGVALTKLTKKQMRGYRKELQIIFQDPYSSLNPRMTVGQIIGEGVAEHLEKNPDGKTRKAYVLEVMKKCGLDEYAYYRYPHEFSGGQRQRVCIARALAVKPNFIVCDECVSALDVSIQAQIINLLSRLKEEEGLTYLFISHDLSVVRHIADRIAVMYLGKIVEIGASEKVFKNALHPYTLALISAAPSLYASAEKKRIYLPPSQGKTGVGCPFANRCFMAKEICFSTPPPFMEVEKGHFASCHFANQAKKDKLALARGYVGQEKEG